MSEYKGLQSEIWGSLTRGDSGLPHALLFAGPRGVGKRETAEAVAARLLCETPRAVHEPACGRCASCVMLASGSHPDFRLVQPEAADEEGDEAGEGDKKKASKQIRIQQIRELESFFHVGGHRGGARVCIIEPAEAMNAVTANSLLKVLEEPSVSFYFIMISHRWHSLLPTLLSRSRRVMFSPPAQEQTQNWLSRHKLADKSAWLPFFASAPLALADAVESGRLKVLESIVGDLLGRPDPLAVAEKWEKHVKADGAISMEDLVTTVQKWLFDLGQVAQGAQPRYLSHKNKELSAIAGRVSPQALLQAQSQLAQLRAWASHPLNARLFLEDLCVRAFRPIAP